MDRSRNVLIKVPFSFTFIKSNIKICLPFRTINTVDHSTSVVCDITQLVFQVDNSLEIVGHDENRLFYSVHCGYWFRRLCLPQHDHPR